MKNIPKLIIPVDGMSTEAVQATINIIRIGNKEYINRILIKFNDQLFKIGADGVNKLMEENKDFSTMQDPKLHDVPQTVANGINQLSESGLADKTEYITIHASGGIDMIKEAVKKRNELGLNTKILTVTVLTSLGEKGAQQSFDETAKHGVLKLAKMALEAGADGIVCSPLEAPILRAVFGEKYPNFLIVTPGIRFADNKPDHQTRITTPAKGAQNANDLVMGGPIINKDVETGLPDAEKMTVSIKRFFKEIDGVKKETANILYEFEKLLYNGTEQELLEYIGAFYNKPEGGKYCRLASKLLSNGYINIGNTERNYLVLERFATTLADKLNEQLGLDEISPANIEQKRNEYIVIGAQMGSVRISSYLAEKLGIETSIYTEKYSAKEQQMDDIEKTWFKNIKSNIILKKIQEILTTKYSDKMILKRHNIDLTGKKIILSEDIVTKGTTLEKMIKIVKELGGTVVAISCIGNRYGKDNFQGIPLIYIYKPEQFELFWDEKTPIEARDNYPKLPENAQISEKPKNEWPELINSQNNKK